MELTNKNVAAIGKAYGVAVRIKQEFPEVAEMYKRGIHIPEIALSLGIADRYSIGKRTAESAVQMAIRGKRGRKWNLDGLICNQDELNTLCAMHRKNAAEENYQNGVGLAGLTDLERSRIGVLGSGRARELGRGIVALSRTELSAAGKKGVLESMKSRGVVPWSDEEKEYAFSLSQLSEYKHQSGGCYRGKPKLKVITELVNRNFHAGREVRSRQTVSAILSAKNRLNNL